MDGYLALPVSEENPVSGEKGMPIFLTPVSLNSTRTTGRD
jgi:hypothetical protein